jgi:hypothetical protein
MIKEIVMSKAYKDDSIIDRKTQKEMNPDFFKKVKQPKQAERKGNPKDSEPFVPHSPGS